MQGANPIRLARPVCKLRPTAVTLPKTRFHRLSKGSHRSSLVVAALVQDGLSFVTSCVQPLRSVVKPLVGSIDTPAGWPSFMASYAAPVATAAGVVGLTLFNAYQTNNAFSFLAAGIGALVIFFLIPLLDIVFGADGVNPTGAQLPALARDAGYRWVLRGYVPLQLLACTYVAWFVATQHPSWAVMAGLFFSVSSVGAVGFTVAHDLIHSPERLDQRLAMLQLASMFYPHWSTSHLGHHAKVATPEDPASARLGEPLWTFMVRSVWGNLVDGFRMEEQRLRDSRTPLWSLKNRMWVWVATPLAMAGCLQALWGLWAVAALLGQALGSVMLLEAVNYVEHYGLSRRKLPSGRYERVAPRHSWNADYRATNAISFKLQRHPDHHLHATRPFQALVSMTEEAPQLPASYPIMTMLACIPPLWFGVMDPIVASEQLRLDKLEQQAGSRKLPSAGPPGGSVAA